MGKFSGKRPSALLSFVPLLVLVVLLFVTIRTFGTDAIAGASQIVLLTGTAVASLLAMVFCGVKWQVIEDAICKNILGVSTAIIILLLIGALSGSWMVSGVVPTMIYYGMKLIDPNFFLATSCIICALVSVMTGSSWTTIATIGVALMGIGKAQGFSEGWIAGAIISGAYFGDKVSPLSDTTVLASSVTDTPLFSHIHYLMYTTVPSILIALAVFLVVGLAHPATSAAQIEGFSQALDGTFHISPWLLLVPSITALLIAKKVPSLITLFLSALMAGICALVIQPSLLLAIGEGASGTAQGLFKGLFITYYGSTGVETGNEVLNGLVITRGMGGMMNTIWLVVCAMCFGGAMQATGMLESLTSVLKRFMKRGVGLVSSTAASGVLLNLVVADQYVAIVLIGNMFKDIYRKKGYDSRVLSRATEDSVTVTSVLVPWNTCGMAQSTILNVPTLTYLPYCFFNLLSPFMSVFMMMIGYKIKRIAK